MSEVRASRTALWLSVFTVAYNVVEGVVSIGFAALANSAALLGFGSDSFVESLSGSIMIWRFWRPGGAPDRERTAARLVGVSLLLLAAYVTYESLAALVGGDRPERSLPAIVIAVVSLIVMPALYLLKRNTARRLGSGSLLADSKQTLACSLLSVALLAGAGLNYWAGIWQADPAAGLLISLWLMWEGRQALTTGETCAC